MNLIKLMEKGIMNDKDYGYIFKLIQRESDEAIELQGIYNSFYLNKDPKAVYVKNKSDNHRSKKINWRDKAIEGYETYQKNGTIRRGFYRHLVSHKLEIEKIKEGFNDAVSSELFTFSNIDSEIERRIEHLNRWLEDSDSFLVEYPFFNKLTPKMKASAIRDDLVTLVGSWIVNNLDIVEQYFLLSDVTDIDSDKLDQIQEETESLVFDVPYFGLSDRVNYSLDDKNNEITLVDDKLKILKNKENFELPDEYKMAIDGLASIDERELRTPDQKDKRVFDSLLNFRDEQFQKNGRLMVPLHDLIKSTYSSVGANNYRDIRNRLFRLGYFRLVKEKDNGAFDIRSLFSGMEVEQDKSGRWYVHAVVSSDIHDNVLLKQFIKIYDNRVKELARDNAYNLAFIIQKKRLLHYKEDQEDIKFNLTWDELNYSIRFNQRSKRQNMDTVAKALAEIKEKNFLIKDVQRYHPLSFIVTCHALNQRELDDMNKVKLIFEEPISEMLLGNE